MTKKKAKTPNPICPHCHVNRYRTLKKDDAGVKITRCCNQPVVRVNGTWHIELGEAPEWKVLKLFEKFKRRVDPEYRIEHGDYAYQENLRSAVTLWQRCERSLDLVESVLDVSFNHEAHRWRNYPALWAVLHNKFFPDAFAKAKIALAKRESRAKSERRVSASQFELGAHIPALG